MLPLIPLAINLVPALTRWLFGDTAANTVNAVTQAVHAVTGSTDIDTASRLLAGSPQMTNQLTVQLAQIAAEREQAAAAAQQAELVARLGDMAGARSQTLGLTAAHSPIAYGAPVVSTVVLLTFGAMLSAVLSHSVPAGSEALAQVMLGTLAGMATAVVQYWVGSSAGSAQKGADLRAAADHLANTVPQRSIGL